MSSCIACDFISPKYAASITFIGGTSGIFTSENTTSSQLTTQVDLVVVYDRGSGTSTIGGKATLFPSLNLVTYYIEPFIYKTDDLYVATLDVDFTTCTSYLTTATSPTFSIDVNSDPTTCYANFNYILLPYHLEIQYFIEHISFTPGDSIQLPALFFACPTVNYIS